MNDWSSNTGHQIISSFDDLLQFISFGNCMSIAVILNYTCCFAVRFFLCDTQVKR